MDDLNDAWTDTTDDTLKALIEQSVENGKTIDRAKYFETKEPAKPAEASEASALIAKALSILTTQTKGQLDEERVIALIAEYSQPQPLRIEVRERFSGELSNELAHSAFPKLLKAVSSGENVWLVGPAGTGKTTAAEQVAKAIGLPFYFNGAIDSEHKLLGFTDAMGRVVSRPFRQAWEQGGVYLFDEVDASLPQAQLAFNAALANGQVDFPDKVVRKHKDFYCIAAANTWGQGASVEYNGRYKPDAAFLDRFSMLPWGVDERLERCLALARIEDQALGNSWIDLVQRVRRNIAKEASLKHVVSPRASIGGCALLQAGFTWEEAIESRLRKGLDATVWNRISLQA
jgi:hypothetical protein